MNNIFNSFNQLLLSSKKAAKYLPFFIGFKILTFTVFITYMLHS